MPLTACPECHHVTAVRRDRLGHRTKCPNCASTFRPGRLPLSLGRLCRADHPAGLWAGMVLLVAGITIGSIAALVGEEPRAAPVMVNVAALLSVVGVGLVIRHGMELSRRPTPVGNRRV